MPVDMTSQMPPDDFEAFVARLLGTLHLVHDAPSLAVRTRWLLEAEVVALLSFDHGDVTLLAVAPPNEDAWAREHVGELRDWYAAEQSDNAPAQFTLEAELSVGARRFADALVASGSMLAGRHELVALGRPGARLYNSYHVTACATLLRLFQARESETRLVQAEQRLRKVFSRVATEQVLPAESWEDFAERIAAAGSRDAAGTLWPSAVISTAYQVRAGLGAGPPEDARSIPDRESARKRFEGRGVPEPYIQAAESLLDLLSGPSSEQGIERLRLTPPEQEAELRQPGAAALHRGAVAAALECAWLRLRNDVARADGDDAPPLDEHAVAQLVDLTSDVLLEALTVAPNVVGGAGESGYTVDRDQLRLYFANLLLRARRLRHAYLLLDEGGRPRQPDGDAVPPAVHREYVLQLARLMLGAVAILERRTQIQVDPSAVSSAEVLDSLLYLVDRYAHVELGVDERLRVREHLARGLRAEVQLHLGKPFYRDHLLHVVDVFLLGHFLLRAEGRLIDEAKRELLTNFVELERLHPPVNVPPDDARLSPERWLRDWAVAALLHDLGYQVAAAAPQGDPKAVAAYFALPGHARPAWLGFDAGPDTGAGLRQYLHGFEGRLRDDGGGAGAWLPAPGADVAWDHGLLSALRLAQVLVQAASSDRPSGEGSFALVAEYRRALHAIAHHNLSSHVVGLETDPMACWLRLCDELQEWSRRRVNIEQTVKRLYLSIEEGSGGAQGDESLRRLVINISVTRDGEAGAGDVGQRGSCDGLRVALQPPESKGPARTELRFRLEYNDSVASHFDPTTTFLSKAYSLQRVDLRANAGGSPLALDWRLELRFPRPAKYGRLSELDIYGLFAERRRELPRLRTFHSLGVASPGLSALHDSDGRVDRVAIVVSGVVSASAAEGAAGGKPSTVCTGFLQAPIDDSVVSEFVAFERELLPRDEPRSGVKQG